MNVNVVSSSQPFPVVSLSELIDSRCGNDKGRRLAFCTSTEEVELLCRCAARSIAARCNSTLPIAVIDSVESLQRLLSPQLMHRGEVSHPAQVCSSVIKSICCELHGPRWIVIVCDNISPQQMEALNSVLDADDGRFMGETVNPDLVVIGVLTIATALEGTLSTAFFERFKSHCHVELSESEIHSPLSKYVAHSPRTRTMDIAIDAAAPTDPLGIRSVMTVNNACVVDENARPTNWYDALFGRFFVARTDVSAGPRDLLLSEGALAVAHRALIQGEVDRVTISLVDAPLAAFVALEGVCVTSAASIFGRNINFGDAFESGRLIVDFISTPLRPQMEPCLQLIEFAGSLDSLCAEVVGGLAVVNSTNINDILSTTCIDQNTGCILEGGAALDRFAAVMITGPLEGEQWGQLLRSARAAAAPKCPPVYVLSSVALPDEIRQLIRLTPQHEKVHGGDRTDLSAQSQSVSELLEGLHRNGGTVCHRYTTAIPPTLSDICSAAHRLGVETCIVPVPTSLSGENLIGRVAFRRVGVELRYEFCSGVITDFVLRSSASTRRLIVVHGIEKKVALFRHLESLLRGPRGYIVANGEYWILPPTVTVLVLHDALDHRSVTFSAGLRRDARELHPSVALTQTSSFAAIVEDVASRCAASLSRSWQGQSVLRCLDVAANRLLDSANPRHTCSELLVTLVRLAHAVVVGRAANPRRFVQDLCDELPRIGYERFDQRALAHTHLLDCGCTNGSEEPVSRPPLVVVREVFDALRYCGAAVCVVSASMPLDALLADMVTCSASDSCEKLEFVLAPMVDATDERLFGEYVSNTDCGTTFRGAALHDWLTESSPLALKVLLVHVREEEFQHVESLFAQIVSQIGRDEERDTTRVDGAASQHPLTTICRGVCVSPRVKRAILFIRHIGPSMPPAVLLERSAARLPLPHFYVEDPDALNRSAMMLDASLPQVVVRHCEAVHAAIMGLCQHQSRQPSSNALGRPRHVIGVCESREMCFNVNHFCELLHHVIAAFAGMQPRFRGLSAVWQRCILDAVSAVYSSVWNTTSAEVNEAVQVTLSSLLPAARYVMCEVEAECPICFEKAIEDDTSSAVQWVRLACGHWIHSGCFAALKAQSPRHNQAASCPTCRGDVDASAQLVEAVVHPLLPRSVAREVALSATNRIVATGSVRQLANLVHSFLDVREWRRGAENEPKRRSTQSVLGLLGAIVIGPSGRGKDLLIDCVIAARRLDGQVCHLNASVGTNYEDFVNVAVDAARRGDILVVSELNILPAPVIDAFAFRLRELLRTREARPGFIVFATVNPPETMQGRTSLTPIVAENFAVHFIEDYAPSEWLEILRATTNGTVSSDRSAAFHEAVCAINTQMQHAGHLHPLPTLRRLRFVCECAFPAGLSVADCVRQQFSLQLLFLRTTDIDHIVAAANSREAIAARTANGLDADARCRNAGAAVSAMLLGARDEYVADRATVTDAVIGRMLNISFQAVTSARMDLRCSAAIVLACNWARLALESVPLGSWACNPRETLLQAAEREVREALTKLLAYLDLSHSGASALLFDAVDSRSMLRPSRIIVPSNLPVADPLRLSLLNDLLEALRCAPSGGSAALVVNRRFLDMADEQLARLTTQMSAIVIAKWTDSALLELRALMNNMEAHVSAIVDQLRTLTSQRASSSFSQPTLAAPDVDATPMLTMLLPIDETRGQDTVSHDRSDATVAPRQAPVQPPIRQSASPASSLGESSPFNTAAVELFGDLTAAAAVATEGSDRSSDDERREHQQAAVSSSLLTAAATGSAREPDFTSTKGDVCSTVIQVTRLQQDSELEVVRDSTRGGRGIGCSSGVDALYVQGVLHDRNAQQIPLDWSSFTAVDDSDERPAASGKLALRCRSFTVHTVSNETSLRLFARDDKAYLAQLPCPLFGASVSSVALELPRGGAAVNAVVLHSAVMGGRCFFADLPPPCCVADPLSDGHDDDVSDTDDSETRRPRRELLDSPTDAYATATLLVTFDLYDTDAATLAELNKRHRDAADDGSLDASAAADLGCGTLMAELERLKCVIATNRLLLPHAFPVVIRMFRQWMRSQLHVGSNPTVDQLRCFASWVTFVFGPRLPCRLVSGHLVLRRDTSNGAWTSHKRWFANLRYDGCWIAFDPFDDVRFPCANEITTVAELVKCSSSSGCRVHFSRHTTAGSPRRWEVLEHLSRVVQPAVQDALTPEFYTVRGGFTKRFSSSTGRLVPARILQGEVDIFEQLMVDETRTENSARPKTIAVTGFPQVWHSTSHCDNLSHESLSSHVLYLEVLHVMLDMGFRFFVWSSESNRQLVAETPYRLLELVHQERLWNRTEPTMMQLNVKEQREVLQMNSADLTGLFLRVFSAISSKVLAPSIVQNSITLPHPGLLRSVVVAYHHSAWSLSAPVLAALEGFMDHIRRTRLSRAAQHGEVWYHMNLGENAECYKIVAERSRIFAERTTSVSFRDFVKAVDSHRDVTVQFVGDFTTSAVEFEIVSRMSSFVDPPCFDVSCVSHLIFAQTVAPLRGAPLLRLRAPFLLSLSLHGCVVDCRLLTSICTGDMPRLRSMSLTQCVVDSASSNPKLRHAVIDLGSSGVADLQHVTLERVFTAPDVHIAICIDSAVNLRTLRISGSDVAFGRTLDLSLLANLEHLRLHNISGGGQIAHAILPAVQWLDYRLELQHAELMAARFVDRIFIGVLQVAESVQRGRTPTPLSVAVHEGTPQWLKDALTKSAPHGLVEFVRFDGTSAGHPLAQTARNLRSTTAECFIEIRASLATLGHAFHSSMWEALLPNALRVLADAAPFLTEGSPIYHLVLSSAVARFKDSLLNLNDSDPRTVRTMLLQSLALCHVVAPYARQCPLIVVARNTALHGAICTSLSWCGVGIQTLDRDVLAELAAICPTAAVPNHSDAFAIIEIFCQAPQIFHANRTLVYDLVSNL